MSCFFDGPFADIPENIKVGLVNYVEYSLAPGGFLTAVIRGELFVAARRADLSSKKSLALVATWLDQNFPGLCGPENMAAHLAKRA